MKVGSFTSHTCDLPEAIHSPLSYVEQSGTGHPEQGWVLPKVMEGVTDLE